MDISLRFELVKKLEFRGLGIGLDLFEILSITDTVGLILLGLPNRQITQSAEKQTD